MKKILVIEDNLEVRENLCEILELADYDVGSAENGKLGIEKASEMLPDLIICDVMMPELDGFGVLKILNKNPKLNRIPLIFLTAKAEKDDFRKGMGLGAEDYITKPFDDVELLEAIEMRLDKAEKINQGFALSDSNAFESNTSKAFEELKEDKELRKYQKKDIVYDKGQNARWLFYIVSGQVKVFITNESGKELTVRLYNTGEFFGYFPLNDDASYTNNASCIEDTTLQLIPKSEFANLLFNNKEFSLYFIKLLATKEEETENKLINLAYSSVREKVATAILTAISNTSDGGDAKKATITLSREDLAAIAGTAKETLIRTLSDFRSEGLLAIKGKTITVDDISLIKNITF